MAHARSRIMLDRHRCGGGQFGQSHRGEKEIENHVCWEPSRFYQCRYEILERMSKVERVETRNGEFFPTQYILDILLTIPRLDPAESKLKHFNCVNAESGVV